MSDARQASASAGPVAPSAAGHGGEGEAFDPAPFRPGKLSLFGTGAVAALVFGGLLAAGIVPRILHRQAMAEEAAATEKEAPRVVVSQAKRSAEASNLTLPGSVQPLQETPIYARANGFVRKWLVDIGTHVKQGQTLVELEVPDIDEELRQSQASANQAKAGIAQAKTQLELARANSNRYGALGPTGVVSQQEVDQYKATFDAQQSNVEAAEAAHKSALAGVARLQDLKAFGVLTAPFDGVVTMRTAEVGQLVTSGTNAGQPLFKVAEVDVVRIFVNVPQLYAPSVHVDMDAPVTVRELPGRTFPGKVARTSSEIDTATRTLLTEVDIPNRDGALIAGMYAQVAFHVVGQKALLFVPATAVLIDAQGTRAATVKDGAIAWKDVQIDADMGDRLAIATGLNEGDVVVTAPSDRLLEGMHVRAEQPQGAGPGAGAGSGAAAGAAPGAKVADSQPKSP